MKILLAEDNVINQKVAAGMLEKWGHEVAAVGNGREALQAMERTRFDLVIMDVDMPVMDGLQAVRTLREKEKSTGRHLPIIALTAHAMKGDRESCLEAGVDAYFSKPVNGKALNEAIELLAAGRRLDVRTASAPDSAATQVVFDRARALEYLGGSEELLAEIAAAFLERAPQLLAEARAAIVAQNAKLLERAAHTLKGSVSIFAADAARAAAGELELLGRTGKLCAVDPIYAALCAEVARLSTALAAICDSSHPDLPAGVEGGSRRNA